jgi:hypothetical protein
MSTSKILGQTQSHLSDNTEHLRLFDLFSSHSHTPPPSFWFPLPTLPTPVHTLSLLRLSLSVSPVSLLDGGQRGLEGLGIKHGNGCLSWDWTEKTSRDISGYRDKLASRVSAPKCSIKCLLDLSSRAPTLQTWSPKFKSPKTKTQQNVFLQFITQCSISHSLASETNTSVEGRQARGEKKVHSFHKENEE